MIKNFFPELSEKAKHVFFTSDTYFSDKSMVNERGFSSTEEMNDYLIQKWNDTVGADDIVYHLGNFGDFGVRDRLNGKIYFILGNEYDKLDEMIRWSYRNKDGITHDHRYYIHLFHDSNYNQNDILERCAINIGMLIADMRHIGVNCIVSNSMHPDQKVSITIENIKINMAGQPCNVLTGTADNFTPEKLSDEGICLFGCAGYTVRGYINGIAVHTDEHNLTPISLEKVVQSINDIWNDYYKYGYNVSTIIANVKNQAMKSFHTCKAPIRKYYIAHSDSNNYYVTKDKEKAKDSIFGDIEFSNISDAQDTIDKYIIGWLEIGDPTKKA